MFTAPNVPGARYTKAILATITSVLVLAVNLISGGVTGAEWLQLLVAAMGAASVYLVPNLTPDTTRFDEGGVHATGHVDTNDSDQPIYVDRPYSDGS